MLTTSVSRKSPSAQRLGCFPVGSFLCRLLTRVYRSPALLVSESAALEPTEASSHLVGRATGLWP